MTDAERRILLPLALMVRQYCWIGGDTDSFDNKAMSAGEAAFEVLAEYGLITMRPGQYRFGEWTEAGCALVRSKWGHC